MDRYDLYVHAAIPKNHDPADIPDLYRLAARSKGLCVNPALAETFGLTLIEAAASGLPLAVTGTGGPRDIVANCKNGVLFDAMDSEAMAAALKDALGDLRRWAEWSRNGLRGVREGYTWEAHVNRYLKAVHRLLRKGQKRKRKEMAGIRQGEDSPFLRAKWVLICDLDGTLVGQPAALERLLAWVRARRGEVAFGVATGRKLESALWTLRQAGVDKPDLLITSVGAQIHYGPHWRPDAGWDNHIAKGWRRDELARALEPVPGLRPQARRRLGPCKLSYYANPGRLPELSEIYALLHRQGLRAKLIYSQSRYLDVLPHGASMGQAVRYLAFKWGLPLERCIVAGDSGNDYDMLTGDTLGIVVGNHQPELDRLRGRERIYFAGAALADGILEGLAAYGV